MAKVEINTFSNYDTVEIYEVEGTKPLHICINDDIDLVIIKNGNDYAVKVLETNTDKVSCELIDFQEYNELLKIEE